mgnify:CR=1 FL=1
MVIHYVLGFLFERQGRLVWLIKKARGPAHLIGKYNGIGGKVEPGENPEEAMRREAREEIDVDCPWVWYGSMGSAGIWTCDLFFADGAGLNPRTMDPTEPGGYDRSDFPADHPLVPLVDNVPALLSLAALARDGTDRINFRLDFLPNKVSYRGP